MTRDREDLPPAYQHQVVGVYLDLTGGESVADMRMSFVECTRAGRLVLKPVDGGALSVVLNHLNMDELMHLLAAVHCPDKRKSA